MGKNVSSAANQQGSRFINDPSETIRRAPFSCREIKAYFLGALHDGTFSLNQRFRISQKGKDWLIFLQNILKKIGYNSWIYKEGRNRKVYVLETLADFLDFAFNPLTLTTKKEGKAYIRGFFDAEGGMPHDSKARFYIQLTQRDKKKLKKIKKLLKDLNIFSGKIHNPSFKVDPKYWRMYILAKSHDDFIRKIGSWHPRKMNFFTKRVKI